MDTVLESDDYILQDEERAKILQEFCLFDDEFMTVVFEDRELAELLLRIILEDPELTVISSTTQHNVQNLFGRSVRLDTVAKDSSGKIFDVEVQRDDAHADPQRARYNSSLLDAHIIKKGEELSSLPETYVIFITENDYWGDGQPLYRIERRIDGCNRLFGDGAHIIYVNGANRDDTDLGHLMADFACKDPGKFYYGKLGKAAGYFKKNEKGAGNVSKIMEEYGERVAKRVAKRVEERTRLENSRSIAVKLILEGTMSYEKIAELTELPLDEIKALAEGQTA